MIRRLLAAILAAGLLTGPAVTAAYADAEQQAVIIAAAQLTDAGLRTAEDAIASASSEYPYGELYDIDAAYALYQKAPIVNTNPTGIIRDGRLDPEELFDTVRANNAAYLTEPANAGKAYMEPSDQTLAEYCRIIAATVEHELARGALTTNYDDLTYNLSHLTVFLANTYENALITEDGCMLVSPVNMQNMKIISGNPDADQITIAHETEHLLQKMSAPAQKAAGALRGYGYCLCFDGLSVNSLFHKWLFEAAAENLACSLYDCGPITYQSRVDWLNSLTLALLLNESFRIFDVERLTQQQELQQVFDTFGCRTEAEQAELLALLEAVDIIQEDDADFWALYAGQLGRELTDADKAKVKLQLENSACTTLSKLFYRSLAERLHRAPMAMSDVFALLSVFEADMNGHISYSESTEYARTAHFLENYLLLQDGLFAALAEVLDVSPDLVWDAFEAYTAGAALEPAAPDIAGLDSAKCAFLARMLETTADGRALSIRSAAALYSRPSEPR